MGDSVTGEVLPAARDERAAAQAAWAAQRAVDRQAKGPGHGGPANGKWDEFRSGDAATLAKQEKGREVARERRELARQTYFDIHKRTAQLMAKLELEAIEAGLAHDATPEEKRQALKIIQDVKPYLMGKPTSQVESHHEVNITSRLRELADSE